MAKIIFCTFLLVVFISTMITLSRGQLAECLTPRCSCCLHQVCGGNDYCTLGCVDGTWGNKCYNPCPGDCATCTKGSLESGYPCTSCIAGTWGNKCYNTCPGDCATCTKGSLESGYPCTSCIVGKYGTDCNNDCPTNCATCTLDSSNRGYICTTCVAEKYGTEDCRTSCSVGCDGGTCKIDGGCTCRDGYSGNKCDSCDSNTFGLFPTCNICPDQCVTCNSTDSCGECLSGFWGQVCDQVCPIGCSMSICNKENENCAQQPCNRDGLCFSCKTGYEGDICDKCIDGYYLESRSDTNCVKCSNFCKHGICEKLTGYCPNGCLDKYWGVACLNSCPVNCLICQRETGICEVCDHGKYKSDCSADCNAECQRTEQGQILCKIQNGHCLTGCRTETLYGPLCQQLCSKNCINNKCNWKTGNCYECEGNKYGLGCEIDCGNNCMDQGKTQSRCYGSNGTCIHECTNGYYGDKCDFECSLNCKTPRCSRKTGQCLDGCLEGLEESGRNCGKISSDNDEDVDSPNGQGSIIGGSVGGSVAVIVLVVILVICVIKRRQHDNNRSGNTSNTSGNQPTNTDYNNPATDLSGQTASEVQPTPEYEELDEMPKDKPECDQAARDTIVTNNYDNLDCQQDDARQYDTIDQINNA